MVSLQCFENKTKILIEFGLDLRELNCVVDDRHPANEGGHFDLGQSCHGDVQDGPCIRSGPHLDLVELLVKLCEDLPRTGITITRY